MVRRCRGTVLPAILTVCFAPAHAFAQEKPAPKFQVDARFMFWADVAQRQSLPDQQETISDFLIRRARVIAQGRPTDSITLYLQVGQDNVGGKLLTDDGSIRIKDAYVNYRIKDVFQAVAGQFKIPFLRINLDSGFNQLLVDRGTLPTLRPSREGSRDLGAMAWGNVSALQYRLAVFDGSDQEVRNTHSSFRLSSRVSYNWFTRETGLGYTGTYIGTTRILQVAAQADVQNDRLDPRDDSAFQTKPRDYRAYGLEAYYEQPLQHGSALTADGMWFARNDDYLEADLPTRRIRGFYVQPGYLLPGDLGPGRLQLAFRYEEWRTERGADNPKTSRTTGGVNYYLKGHNRKLQTDYTWKRESPSISNDEFRLSLVVVF